MWGRRRNLLTPDVLSWCRAPVWAHDNGLSVFLYICTHIAFSVTSRLICRLVVWKAKCSVKLLYYQTLLDIWKNIPCLRFPGFTCLSLWFWSTGRIMDGGENLNTQRKKKSLFRYHFVHRKFNLNFILRFSSYRSGIESRWGRDFLSVQTGPGAHPASCAVGTGAFPEVEVAGAWGWRPHPHLVSKALEKSRAIHLLTLRACVAYKIGWKPTYRSVNTYIPSQI